MKPYYIKIHQSGIKEVIYKRRQNRIEKVMAGIILITVAIYLIYLLFIAL